MNDWVLLCQSMERIKSEIRREDLSDKLYLYLVTAEDHRFWLHYGFDPISLVRAVWKTKFRNSREGGSTVAMQLVRTVTGNYEVSLKRKVKEIYLAIRLTRKFNKYDILKAYLSVAYFGWNMHGIEQACNKLKLNKSHLNDHDAALIIARLKYPEPRYFNFQKAEKIKFRAAHILHRFQRLNSVGRYGAI